MIIVGLTGSIAMGKSEVAQVFRTQAIPVFDADQEVHAFYASPEGAEMMRQLAPEAVQDGKVSRSVLSHMVVENPGLLNKLETIVHAEIASRRTLFISQAEKAGHAIVVLDIPLLFEKTAEKQLDVTVVVSAPADRQRQRALARPGMTIEKLDMILKRQMPDAEKRRLANYTILNGGNLTDLRQATLAVLENIKKEYGL
jgi:dephospho-CoA kinase